MHTCVLDNFCISIGVLFTGRGKLVTNDDGTPLLMNNGSPRLGRGLAESTFRKIYQGLRTLHIHFQKQMNKIQKHFQNVLLVGRASKNYTYKCVDRSRHNGIKGAKAKCAH